MRRFFFLTNNTKKNNIKMEKKNNFGKFSLSITRNLGNYESLKLEGEWTPSEKDTDAASVCKAQKQLEAAIAAAMVDRVKAKCHTLNCDSQFRAAHKAEGEKYPQAVTAKDEELIKSIIAKVEQGTSIETVFKFYCFNDKITLEAVSTAAAMNANLFLTSTQNTEKK